MSGFTCPHCNRSFAVPARLAKHIEKKVCQKRHTCSFCPFEARDKFNLDRHVRHRHAFGPQRHSCPLCPFTAIEKYHVERHVRHQHAEVANHHSCPFCSFSAIEKYDVDRHVRLQHAHAEAATAKEVFKCGFCPLTFTSRAKALEHREDHILVLIAELGGNENDFILKESAHNGAHETFRFHFKEEEKVTFVPDALACVRSRLEKRLDEDIFQKKLFKFTLTLAVELHKIDAHGQPANHMIAYFKTGVIRVDQFTNLRDIIEVAEATILVRCDEFLHKGSGWSVTEVLFMDYAVAKFRALAGSCGLHKIVRKPFLNIDLRSGFEPEAKRRKLQDKEEDPQDCDEDPQDCDEDPQDCFLTAVAASFLPEGSSLAQLRDYVKNTFKVNVALPVTMDGIKKFEEDNKALDLCINVVYKDEEGKIFPARASPNYKASNTIVLLMAHVSVTGQLDNHEDSIDSMLHYALLRDPSKDLGLVLKQRNGWMRRYASNFCYNCFNYFKRETALDAHVKWCHTKKGQLVEYPNKGEVMCYEKKGRDQKIGYLIFFDFECLQEVPQKSCECQEEDNPCCHRRTHVVTEQNPFSYALTMVSRHGKVVEEDFYSGKDAAHHLVKRLMELDNKYSNQVPVPMILTDADRESIDRATVCYLCEKPFEEDDRRVKDHDHINGQFLGVAHNICNLQRKERKSIVALCHNFSGILPNF